MKKCPIIGIISSKQDVGEFLPLYGTGSHYLEQIQLAGGIPIQVPVMSHTSPEALTSMVSCCDGFLLPGGGDFFPEWYGQTLLPGLKSDTFSMDWERQKITLELVKMMVSSGKPILGICLGLPLLWAAFCIRTSRHRFRQKSPTEVRLPKQRIAGSCCMG